MSGRTFSRTTVRRTLMLAAALVGGSFAIWSYAARTQPAPAQPGVSQAALVARGRSLFVAGCASCHGLDARGVHNMGPSLRGVGAQAADFYLRTGRMPLNNPKDQPNRNPPAYPPDQIAALTAYIGFLGGPPIPHVDPAMGNISDGKQSFIKHCAGCHQALARGGIATGAIAPTLEQATPTQVAEAVRIGPYLMPHFTTRQINQTDINNLARYVQYTKHPDNRGGWALGNIGPIPEGMVAWFIGLLSLLIVARLIGERMEQ